MKISFIVPVYCTEAYIGQCVESLQAQNEVEIEIILVDDGSPDHSGKICDEYAQKDKRITVIHQENRGVSAARNAGLCAAQGDWVCFIDGDDAVVPNLCQDFRNYLNEIYDVCFFGHLEVLNERFPGWIHEMEAGSCTEFDETDFAEFQLAAFNRDYPGKYDYHKIKLSTPCKFYRRSLLTEHKILFPEGVVTGEDCLFNLLVYRYARRGIYLDYTPYLHRVWSHSVSQRYSEYTMERFQVFHKKLQEYIMDASKPELFEKVYAQRCIWTVGFCCILDYCHKDNPKPYMERRADFMQGCDSELGKIAEYAALQNFRLEKRILFWFVKKKWFFMVNLLCFMKSRIGKGA